MCGSASFCVQTPWPIATAMPKPLALLVVPAERARQPVPLPRLQLLRVQALGQAQ